MGTTLIGDSDGFLDSRTNSAQILAGSESPKMKFPKVIRHRKAEVTIYGKKANYPFYRIAYRSGGKRYLLSFKKYGDALAAAEKKAEEVHKGSQNLSLSAKEANDALTIRHALDNFYASTGQRVTAIQAVTGFIEAAKMLPVGQNLVDAIRVYAGTIAVVKRKDLAEAVTEFCSARTARAEGGFDKRPALNPVYAADTKRQLDAFAKTFPGHAVSDLVKDHLDTYIGSHKDVSPKTRNHLRTTIRMFLGWCVRRDYLAGNHRLLEADGLRKEPLRAADLA